MISIALTVVMNCSKSTGPEPEKAKISFQIEYSNPVSKQTAADSVHVKVFQNDVIYDELDLTVGDSTATGSVTLDFGEYDFRIELFTGNTLIYYGEKKKVDVNVNTTTVKLVVVNVPVLTTNIIEVDFGDVLTV